MKWCRFNEMIQVKRNNAGQIQSWQGTHATLEASTKWEQVCQDHVELWLLQCSAVQISEQPMGLTVEHLTVCVFTVEFCCTRRKGEREEKRNNKERETLQWNGWVCPNYFLRKLIYVQHYTVQAIALHDPGEFVLILHWPPMQHEYPSRLDLNNM